MFGEIEQGGSFYDVIAFLGRARWRGELVVHIDDVRRALFFDEGFVVAAETASPNERIGEILVSEGLLAANDVDRCLEAQSAKYLRFGEAAVELGLATTEAIFRAMDLQLQSVFSAVVREEHGAFYFLLDYDETSLSFRQRHSVSDLLGKSLSTIERIDYFRSRIPSDEHVPTRAGDGAPPLTRDPLGLFEAVDGQRTVADLREQCGGEQLAVLRGLFELVQAGYVSIEPPRIGTRRVVEIYNRAISLLLCELDAMDEGDDVRAKLARFAEDAPAPLFAGAGPADDGTLDEAVIEANVEAVPCGEALVTKWLYDYASYALFLARPHLIRRDGAHPPRDDARVSMRVAALLAPIAPRGQAPTVLPEISIVDAPPPRVTIPVRVTAEAGTPAATKKTAQLTRFELPGVDPTKTVRMAPVTEARLAAAAERRARPAAAAQVLAPPRRLAPAPLPAPLPAPPPRSGARLPVALLAGVAVVASLVTAIGTIAVYRSASPAPPATKSELVVVCEPECSTLHLDGARMDKPHGSFEVSPGTHEVVGTRPGSQPVLQRVDVEGGESRAVVVAFEEKGR